MKRADKSKTEFSEEKPESLKKRILMIGVKIIFTLAALYLIVTKADLAEIWHHLENMYAPYIIFALISLNIGQVMSALRTRFYFRNDGVAFYKKFSIALYYIGMFFNRLLPGGIGGDAYIAYVLKRKKKIPVRTSIRILLSSRASGLLLLMVFAFLLGYVSDLRDMIPHWNILMTVGIAGTIFSYSFLTRLLLREKVETQIGAQKYSIVVQGGVMAAAWFLFMSANTPGQMSDYLMIFMISSVVTMIPISFGGVGMRELTYFYTAGIIGINPELGIAVSLVYFLLDTFSSLAGLFFLYRIDKIPTFEK